MVAGTMESLDSLSSTNHFDPLYFLTNTRMAYEYTLLPQVKNLCDKMGAEEEGSSLVFKFEYYFCQDNGHKLFKLEYRNSAPFAGASTMILSGVHCSDDGKFRVNIGFFNGTDVGFVESVVPNRTLVGEGFWDRGRDRLCFIGCSAITLGDSTGEASVGDCSIGFSLWFPALLSLRSRSSPVGKIWSNRDKTDPAYFDTVKFRSINKDDIFICSEYNYTVTDAAIEMRLRRTNHPHSKKKKKLVFPDAETFNRLMFDMKLRNSQGRTVSGYAGTLFLGRQLYCDSFVVEPRFFRKHTVTETNRRVINVSYSIRYELFLGSSGIISSEEAWTSKEVYYMKEEEISAEGIYDSETGMLYMVGCRHVGSVSIFNEPGDQGDDSLDCNLRVEIQIPPENSERGKGFNGTIWSTREEHDPLYFAPVEVSSHDRLYSQAEPESFEMVDVVQMSAWVDADKFIFSAYFLVVYIFIGLLFIHLKRPDMGSRSS